MVEIVADRVQAFVFEVDQIDIGQPGLVTTRKNQSPAIGRKRRRRHSHHAFKSQVLHLFILFDIPDIKMIPPSALSGKSQQFSVGRDRRPRPKRVQRFENGQPFSLDHNLRLAAVKARAHDLGIALVVAKMIEPDAVAVGYFGFDIKTRFGARFGQFIRWVVIGDIGQVVLVQMVLPGFVEFFQRFTGSDLEDLGEGLRPPPILKKLFEDIFAVPVGHEMADRLAFFVHLIGAVDIVHLGDGHQSTGKERVADDHIAETRPLARPIFGQALGKPQRGRTKIENRVPLHNPGDAVKSEDMHQFVV